MITIAMVLRTGGEYDHRYVNNLVAALKRHVSVSHRIMCLTDGVTGLTKDIDEYVMLRHDWPRWWGKIELFRGDVFGGEQIFYFDLDTVIVDNIDEILQYRGEFMGLLDFYQPKMMASGLMSWHGEQIYKIYDEFIKDETEHMRYYSGGGDGGFVRAHHSPIEFFQTVFPGKIVSYKDHCCRNRNAKNDTPAKLPKGAKIVCFHGHPRPHEITNDFRKYWEQA